MATWTATHFLDDLKTRLEARAGLSGVQVASGPMGTATKRLAVVLANGEITGSQEWAALSRMAKNDTFRIPCSIWVNKPGSGETVTKSARDQAIGYLAEVEAEVKKADYSFTGQSQTFRPKEVNLTDISLMQGVSPDGRFAQLDFYIEAEIRI